MRHVRFLCVLPLAVAMLSRAGAQDAAESRPATQPAAESAPASRAEIRQRHPRLGIRVDAAALERHRTARVDQVAAGSPAERAGVKVGDVLAKVDGREIHDDKSYREAMSRKRPGESVLIVVRRGSDEIDLEATLDERPSRAEPDAILIQHVLIGCGDRAKPDKSGKKRTVEEARKLATEVMVKAKNGADFGALVRAHSEDPGSVSKNPPGSYAMVGDGKPKVPPDATEKSGMVPGFSAVAFALEVGDVAMSPYDPELSPYGFHVIKRVK
jgi:hypothetical protein